MSLFFMLSCYGLCFALINKAKFLRRLSFFEKMLNCVYCTGFHAGWIISVLAYLLCPNMVSKLNFGELIITSFASATFCYTLDTIIIYLEHKTTEARQSENRTLFG